MAALISTIHRHHGAGGGSNTTTAAAAGWSDNQDQKRHTPLPSNNLPNQFWKQQQQVLPFVRFRGGGGGQSGGDATLSVMDASSRKSQGLLPGASLQNHGPTTARSTISTTATTTSAKRQPETSTAVGGPPNHFVGASTTAGAISSPGSNPMISEMYHPQPARRHGGGGDGTTTTMMIGPPLVPQHHGGMILGNRNVVLRSTMTAKPRRQHEDTSLPANGGGVDRYNDPIIRQQQLASIRWFPEVNHGPPPHGSAAASAQPPYSTSNSSHGDMGNSSKNIVLRAAGATTAAIAPPQPQQVQSSNSKYALSLHGRDGAGNNGGGGDPTNNRKTRDPDSLGDGEKTTKIPHLSARQTHNHDINTLPFDRKTVKVGGNTTTTHAIVCTSEEIAILNKLGRPFNPSRVQRLPASQLGTCVLSEKRTCVYRLDRVLQSAIYGAVYAATQYSMQNPPQSMGVVAIKIMSKEVEASQKTRLQEDISAELRFQSAMQGHKNVLTYNEVWQDKFCVYIVMPLAEFEDLFEVIKKRGIPFSEKETRWLFRRLLDAAQYLNSRGIGFRDHSLENVLMFLDTHPNSKERFTVYPKIADPGQAIQIKTDQNGRVADVVEKDFDPDRLFGKSFRPPEVYLNRPYNPVKVDTFCLGWMLFFCVTKRQPFEKAINSDSNWRLLACGRFPDLLRAKGIAGLSASLIDLLTAMLSPHPALRLTPKQCLSHPWFGDGPDCPIDDRTVYAQSAGWNCHNLPPHPPTVVNNPLTLISPPSTNIPKKSSSIKVEGLTTKQPHISSVATGGVIGTSLQHPTTTLLMNGGGAAATMQAAPTSTTPPPQTPSKVAAAMRMMDHHHAARQGSAPPIPPAGTTNSEPFAFDEQQQNAKYERRKKKVSDSKKRNTAAPAGRDTTNLYKQMLPPPASTTIFTYNRQQQQLPEQTWRGGGSPHNNDGAIIVGRSSQIAPRQQQIIQQQPPKAVPVDHIGNAIAWNAANTTYYLSHNGRMGGEMLSSETQTTTWDSLEPSISGSGEDRLVEKISARSNNGSPRRRNNNSNTNVRNYRQPSPPHLRETGTGEFIFRGSNAAAVLSSNRPSVVRSVVRSKTDAALPDSRRRVMIYA